MAELELTEAAVSALTTSKVQEEFYDSAASWGGSFGVRVSSSGKRVFFLIYTLHGKRKRMTLGTFPIVTLKQARRAAKSLLREVAMGRDPAAEKRRYRTSDSFAELSQRFLVEHAEARLKPGTVREYRRIIATEFLPGFADRKAGDIAARDVVRLLDAIASGRGSSVMANRARALLSAIFKFGIAVGILEGNPAGETNPFVREAPNERAMSLVQLCAIWKLLDEEQGAAAAAVKMMMLTVQRTSDILSMRWADITFETWQLSASEDKALRHLPLSPPAMQLLRHRFAETGGEGFVFPARQDSSAHMQYLGKALSRLNTRMNLEWRFSFYDLRRSIEVRLRELGIRPDVVELLLNRQTAFKRLKASSGQYDYSEDVTAALSIWAKALVPPPPPRRSDPNNNKVVQLFPRRPS